MEAYWGYQLECSSRYSYSRSEVGKESGQRGERRMYSVTMIFPTDLCLDKIEQSVSISLLTQRRRPKEQAKNRRWPQPH